MWMREIWQERDCEWVRERISERVSERAIEKRQIIQWTTKLIQIISAVAFGILGKSLCVLFGGVLLCALSKIWISCHRWNVQLCMKSCWEHDNHPPGYLSEVKITWNRFEFQMWIRQRRCTSERRQTIINIQTEKILKRRKYKLAINTERN